MFARSLARCARPRVSLPLRCRARRYSTSSSGPASAPAPPQSSASVLGSLTSELDRLSPRFEIEPSQIQILQDPSEFYETLKTKISNAKSRVYLSTLYIGKTEHELISVVRDALLRSPDLKVSFLTDALRGTREAPNPSCASLLAPLVAEFGPARVEVRMFHTPNLHGWRKRLIPRRINEGWGLQHMKLYGVDDELILSGANLSDDYFTNRQDRYHVFASRPIADYFHRVHSAICSLSFLVQPADSDPAGFTMHWPETNPAPSPLADRHAFKSAASTLLAPLMRAPASQTSTALSSSSSSSSSASTTTNTTLVYPLLQFTPILPPNADTSTELPALTTLLTHLAASPTPSTWTFTAGYFNMTPGVRKLLLRTRPAAGTVIAASPHANGFYASPGVSGMLPAAYTLLARRFLRARDRAGLHEAIELREWKRGIVNTPGGWSYHAKGIWVALADEPGQPGAPTDAHPPAPALTLLGSSNYTHRSYALDLEASALVVTTNPLLQQRLGREVKALAQHAAVVDRDTFAEPERRVGWKVRLAMGLVWLLGGAL
ncbi:uncharacterized protein K452DRAFT_317928 [Aplosporella prunicola CBS 121167]|uniref:CDP-diacylglycerol--glycerol-3-phosphate 3-phosphatidyltransferase n=1 Tax=Aplosporella prunicola CBS 121167 TaxID=1176127 RepID=A0A6A6BI90_9PEZI|nr:uncharacterized protein K452DRAFT_317928 [Aplosporella prunicola CBS 121167]KAF2143055.1 hypothetical protein K452DRAFT_317928 [Aplosporella prunicola CBS 121167]